MKQVPNIFTLLNLLFGCIAIVFILQNGLSIQYNDEAGQFVDLSENVRLGALFILLAAVVDFADGFLARLMNAESPMGAQLDSLSDVVSFGVAPAIILYQFLRLSFAASESGPDTSVILLLPAFILAGAAAWRLARFNLTPATGTRFAGVPVPAIGLLVASFPLIYWNNYNPTVQSVLLNRWFLYAVVIGLSALMVSRLPMLSLKLKGPSPKKNLPQFILLLIAVIAALLLHWLAVPIVFIFYVLLSLLFKPAAE